jgi:hypothetical protein
MAEPDEPATLPAPESSEALSRGSSVRWIAGAFLITALVVGFIFYRLIWDYGFGHSSLMFIGLPAVLAILLLLAPRPKSATGSILRGITLALLVVAPLVGEGYLCILFAAPLFLGVGLCFGFAADKSRAKRSTTVTCIAVLLLPMSLEGVVPWLTPDRALSVEATETVSAPESEVVASLAQSPDVTATLPTFLRIGFPRPLSAHGAGLAVGDLRTIHFTGAEGDPPGDLVMRVTAVRPGYVCFDSVSNSSKLTQWIRWRRSEVTYRPIDSTHSAVTWRISFDRQLDPFWYFTPWEKIAVHKAAGYLIAANATPRR